ncbi:MAG: hypothetical protein IJA60_01700 [Clostridia bacterium]|nr:hypothetical protein [Clostridia bacterium]
MSLFDIFKTKKKKGAPPPTKVMSIEEKTSIICKNAGVPFGPKSKILFCSDEYPVVIVDDKLIIYTSNEKNEEYYQIIPLKNIDLGNCGEFYEHNNGKTSILEVTGFALFDLSPKDLFWYDEAVCGNYFSPKEARYVGMLRRAERLANYAGFPLTEDNPVRFSSFKAVYEARVPRTVVFAKNILFIDDEGTHVLPLNEFTDIFFPNDPSEECPKIVFTMIDGSEVKVTLDHACEIEAFINAVGMFIMENNQNGGNL